MAKRVPKSVRILNIVRAIPRPLFMYVSVPLLVYSVVSSSVSEEKLYALIGFMFGIFGVREVGKIYRGSHDSSESSFYREDYPRRERTYTRYDPSYSETTEDAEMEEAFNKFNNGFPDDSAPMKPPDI